MNLCVTVSSFASLDFPACFCGSCGETVKPVCCRAHETDTRSADMAEHLHPLCRSHDPQSAADLRPFRGIRSVRGARRCRWKSRRSHGERPVQGVFRDFAQQSASWWGIRYAEPPVGANRFKEPKARQGMS